MSKLERVLAAGGSLLLVISIFLPLWRINIWAPQYPEGITMLISANKLEGSIDQINILNHYIGMKPINQESIPELEFIPYIMISLAVLGVMVVLTGNRLLAFAWFLLFIGAALLGFYDYYLWSYDYGHNLNPDAPIKVPGMSYQPPVIGSKMLLNFEAFSFPASGGILLALGVILAFLSCVLTKLSFRKLLLLPLLFIFGCQCSINPSPIEVGVDSCEQCKMQIMDLKFGGELITKKGKIFKFDSLLCMGKYYTDNANDIASVWAVDYSKPGNLIEASKAQYLFSSQIHGPMGHSVLAVSDKIILKKLQNQFNAEVLDWDTVIALDF